MGEAWSLYVIAGLNLTWAVVMACYRRKYKSLNYDLATAACALYGAGTLAWLLLTPAL